MPGAAETTNSRSTIVRLSRANTSGTGALHETVPATLYAGPTPTFSLVVSWAVQSAALLQMRPELTKSSDAGMPVAVAPGCAPETSIDRAPGGSIPASPGGTGTKNVSSKPPPLNHDPLHASSLPR